MDYNFLNLSPEQFEDLSADLIGRELGIRFELFAKGPDEGMDGRCSIGNTTTILQSKHYRQSGISKLNSVMKNEKSIIDQTDHTHYILATSVSLTPGNKNTLLDIIGPTTSLKNIYGCEDLNGLLRKYPEIKIAHKALWSESSEVLGEIISNSMRDFKFSSNRDISTLDFTLFHLWEKYIQHENICSDFDPEKDHHFDILIKWDIIERFSRFVSELDILLVGDRSNTRLGNAMSDLGVVLKDFLTLINESNCHTRSSKYYRKFCLKYDEGKFFYLVDTEIEPTTLNNSGRISYKQHVVWQIMHAAIVAINLVIKAVNDLNIIENRLNYIYPDQYLVDIISEPMHSCMNKPYVGLQRIRENTLQVFVQFQENKA